MLMHLMILNIEEKKRILRGIIIHKNIVQTMKSIRQARAHSGIINFEKLDIPIIEVF